MLAPYTEKKWKSFLSWFSKFETLYISLKVKLSNGTIAPSCSIYLKLSQIYFEKINWSYLKPSSLKFGVSQSSQMSFLILWIILSSF